MSLQDLLDFNQKFVEDKSYEAYRTDVYPNKKMVIFTCMESRLLELLHRALNLENGDAKIVKNAGAIIRKPFDSIVKSILVAVYNLKADEVIVIGHHDCGMSNVDVDALKQRMLDRGISEERLNTLEYSGIDLDEEFHGFTEVENSVTQSTEIIRNHPLLPEGIKVHGLVIDPHTGKVDVVTRDGE
ncbi:beta-class carbonic anhydrase [Oceanobacillus alkalisoli]|uniref:beta-class carbonic anhydrase n=1 Tax=Oceanobacillus alkalisoli TaxID=2925113 RepID=UPI001EF0E0CD|nr:carbonic anhydrase [Oceanobacillus alkalisoli]MCF3941965.1 carbonic anhydrase [Oceanobacillus alkalisoli]MCG5102082.1 carbonic anhydrase [Oceanobacillus alkalisoli]